MRRFAAYLALVLLAAPASMQAQSSADTPAGRRLDEFVAVISSDDEARLRTMIQESFAPAFRDAFPIDEHLQILGRLAEETGGVEVVDVRVSSPTELRARLRPRSGAPPLGLMMRIEPEPPHKIASIGIGPADDAPRPEAAVSPAEAARQLRARVAELAAQDRFSGVVLLEKDGEILLHEAWGEAEKAFGAANGVDTKFNLGSMNKMFTAVTVANLVEKGRLSLDDPIGEYLGAEWLRPGIGDRVTIEHLLTHTSGLGSYFSPELMELNPGRFREIDDFQEIVRRDSLRFEPGTRWSYSNTGFLLLGAIVEKVTGRSYYDVVREVVYQPAGMVGTDAYMFDEPTENLAIGYERSGDHWRTNAYGHVARGGPAGGGYSTAPDLLAFARALRENRLLSPEMTRRVTSPKPELSSPEYGYGFGFWNGGTVVGHTGGAPGINAALQVDLDGGYTLIVMSNYGQAAIPIVRYADALLGYAGD